MLGVKKIVMRKKKIFVNLHYMPLHLNPFYKKFGYKIGDYPNSEDYGKKKNLDIYYKFRNLYKKKMASNS